ncbi:MAG: carbohydrate ABC transporter permease [bacterium]|nr:carbohydrate ABC transporter permease [bacterium]
MNKKLPAKILKGSGYFLMIFFLFFPILWLVLTAFKMPKDAYSTRLFFSPTFQNFIKIFTPPQSFAPLVLNSILVAVSTIFIGIPVATMAAYAFSRYQFFGKSGLLVSVLSTQFIPPVVIVLPFFSLFRTLRLIDTRTSLVILNLSFVLPFAIWMIKGFIDGIPREIEQAAAVDGCHPFQVLWYVTLPTIMPGVITSAVFGFIQAWNEFLFALILTQRRATTLTVGLMSLNTERGILWEQMAATSLIIMVPIFILSFSIRKYFIAGLTMGAVK